ARSEESARLVQDERIRIARELHDVVAHSIAAITIQAGMAQHVFDSNPAQARQALTEIRDLSKHALIELRGTLGLLRSSTELPSDRAPMPGMQHLNDLVATAEAAGVHTRITIVGRSRPLAPTVDLTLFRVLQESLTNIVRHVGRDADATIAITYLPDAIQLVVTDQGPPAPQSRSPYTGGSGLGLIGMHERVEAAGGSMSAGQRLGSGFEVSVLLPTGSKS
ncbi:MAG TPA: histidine kinase, partial [Thermomicrobiales bacterium]|nr:histidine kinase [Thermomicrobiales bacterium]